MRRVADAVFVLIVVALQGCDLLGRPMIIDECGRVIQTSRFIKCAKVVEAKEPCPPGVVKQPVSPSSCGE